MINSNINILSFSFHISIQDFKCFLISLKRPRDLVCLYEKRFLHTFIYAFDLILVAFQSDLLSRVLFIIYFSDSSQPGPPGIKVCLHMIILKRISLHFVFDLFLHHFIHRRNYFWSWQTRMHITPRVSHLWPRFWRVASSCSTFM